MPLDRMRFCPACRLVTEHDDPTTDYCLRERCVARRMGVAGSRDPSPFVEVRTAKRKKRIKYAKPKHARRSRRAEPKYRIFEESERPGQAVSNLLGAKLPIDVLQKLHDLKRKLEA